MDMGSGSGKAVGPWRRNSAETRYENPWIRVEHHEVTTPAGTPGIYGLVHMKSHAVGIVPIDEQGNTWLVGQYRYALDAYSWEIPEGGCPLGSDPLDTAKRELAEETGLRAEDWQHLLDIHTSNSVVDEAGSVYVARKLTQGEQALEDSEDITLRKLPLSEAIAMAMRGEITDSLSLAALFKLAALDSAELCKTQV